MRGLKHLIIKSLIVIGLPPLLLLGIYIGLDPFKVLGSYKSYYGEPGEYPVQAEPNHSTVIVNTFLNYNDSLHYDSYIIGSSISAAFFVNHWLQFLPPGASPLHMWTGNQSPYTTRLFIEFLARHNARVNNVLIPVPPDWLDIDETSYSSLFIRHPEIEPDVSWADYHWCFVKSFYNRDFLRSYIMGRIYGHSVFVSNNQAISRLKKDVDPYTLDEYRAENESMIHNDPESFYSERAELFNFPRRLHMHAPTANDRAIAEIRRIQFLLDSLGADYHIVMTPRLDMAYANDVDESILHDVFGDRFINLSKRYAYLAETDTLFYDNIHYRFPAADIFMREVYGSNSK